MPNLVVIAGPNGAGKSSAAPLLIGKRLDDLAASGVDFAFETTLASRSFAPWIARLRRERGYRFHLSFLWLPSADMAVQRVAGRVRHGGHSVPPDHIRRRYERGLSNFFKLYSPIADSWEMHENTSPPPALIAMKDEGRPVHLARPELWESIQGRMQTATPSRATRRWEFRS